MAEPPKRRSELPTEEALRELSHNAQVTYATRCALRAFPLVREVEEVPVDSVITLEKVLMTCTLISVEAKFSNKSLENLLVAAETARNTIHNKADATIDELFKEEAVHTAHRLSELSRAADIAYNAVLFATKSELPINIVNEMIPHYIEGSYGADHYKEARSDFDDLSQKSKNADLRIDKDFYNKPLWIHLNEYENSETEQYVGKWVKFIQAQSEQPLPTRYGHFFDSRTFGKIPWSEIETEVREWLNELEKTTFESSLNADGIPSSLGSRMSDIDLLGRQNLVNSLAAMIASPGQDTPFTIGLLGDWGSGKSNVMHLLRKALGERADKYRFYFADFNAWEYEHTDNMAAGVAQEVLKAFFDRNQSDKIDGLKKFWNSFTNKLRHFFWKCKIRLKFGYRENGWFLPSMIFLLLIFGVLSLVMTITEGHRGWIASLVVTVLLLLRFIKHVFTIIEHPFTTKVNSYLKLPSYTDHLGTIPMLKRHLRTLCDLIIPPDNDNPNRLIVFVDDLDRCEPQAISKTLDAIRLVMDIENVVVIIGIDHRIAFRAVEKQYVELADDERTSADIARDYLGKIIQLPVILSKPGESELENFISNSLFKGVEDPHEVENQVESIEETGKSKTDAETNESVENQEGKTVVLVGQNATEGGEDKPDISKNEITQQIRESDITDDTDAKQLDQVEDMAETGEEKVYFSELCKLFGLHNPRQLIRLRNCFRLLKRIYKSGENEWRPQMTMLFWLEFLFALKQEDRIMIEKCILDNKADSIAECLKYREVQSEQIVKKLKNQFKLENGKFDIYSKIEKQVKRLVLPHSESAKRAKEEEQADTDEKKSKKDEDPKADSE